MVLCGLPSRRGAVFICAFAVVLVVTAPESGGGKLELLGRLVLAYVAASVASRLLGPLIPRPLVANLEQRAILVTGCSSGFGLKTTVAFDQMGVHVIATCRTPSAPAVLDLQKNASSRLHVVKMDVGSDESVAAAAKEVRRILEENALRLWAVVNNAGVLQIAEGPWITTDDLQDILNVNTCGHVRVVREFLPMLVESRGRIVNILSLSCRVIVPVLTPYIMSKKASLAFAEGCRVELRRFGVSVHTIEPCAYETRMALKASRDEGMEAGWDHCPDHIKELYGRDYCQRLNRASEEMGRTILPEEKVRLVTDAVVDACLALDPQDRYVPSLFGTTMEVIFTYCPWLLRMVCWYTLPKIKK